MIRTRGESLWGVGTTVPAASFLLWWELLGPRLGRAAAWGKAQALPVRRSWTLLRARFSFLWGTTARQRATRLTPAAPSINSLPVSPPGRESRSPWDSGAPSPFTRETSITPTTPQPTALAASTCAAEASQRQNLTYSEFRSTLAP